MDDSNRGPLPGITLDDLPEARREALLWRYACELDYDGVDDLVRTSSPWPCRWQLGRRNAPRHQIAIMGSDGRYHLAVNGRLVCASWRWRGGPHHHEQTYRWRVEEATYRLHPATWSADQPVPHHQRTVSWQVHLTLTTLDAALVPHRQRCPVNRSMTTWPRYRGPGAKNGKLFTTLVTALGEQCHACRQAPAVYIDHDHFTGGIRGLLCHYCNTNIGTCPHPANCPWADYLNNPPAAALNLRYPEPSRWLKAHQAKIDYLGIDPFFALRGRTQR
ncbi:endonuclease domain-containing protein [Planomonospora parontospora]|uniref:endonuclease domain-containing protein n=1 Tax=Planomonospora parontospora TaxID=58119 RepID=UPI0019450EE3|nr:endonuclease domain-containing protein [Planomonospora parontospora]